MLKLYGYYDKHLATANDLIQEADFLEDIVK